MNKPKTRSIKYAWIVEFQRQLELVKLENDKLRGEVNLFQDQKIPTQVLASKSIHVGATIPLIFLYVQLYIA